MIAVQASGVLSKPAETRQTQKGNTFAFSSVKIQHPDGDQYVNVTAFDPALVDILTGLKPGDPITIVGQAKLSTYTTRDGDPRPSLSVTASRILSIADKAAPPRQRQRQSRQGASYQSRTYAHEPPAAPREFAPIDGQDPIPF